MQAHRLRARRYRGCTYSRYMAPEWNSSGVLGGPDRRHGERRSRDRVTPDRRLRVRRTHMRTAMLAAAMSSAPMARPAIALFPATSMMNPQVDVETEFEFVKPSEAYEEIIQDAAA